MIASWLLCGVMTIIVIILIIKITLMQKSMKEICEAIEEHLSTDTNRLITVSSGDKHARHLAERISKQLSLLRKQRRKYLNGDRELKEAVTNISHDLRTPLTAICGYLELLENEEKSENVERYIAQISNRTEALKALTEELFRYSVITSATELNYEKLNINRVLEDTLVSFYGAFEQKKITPEISISDAPVIRELDTSALSRIFDNIINNAAKYSDGDFCVFADEHGKIIFSNTSAELSSVDVGKLFDRFFTVDSARRSTGLGLSIAKLLTERMGGTIRAEYREGSLYITVEF